MKRILIIVIAVAAVGVAAAAAAGASGSGGGEHRSEDGSRPWKPTADFDCDPSQTLPGG